MKGCVYNNEQLAGSIEKDENGHYLFQYDDAYFNNKQNPPISLTLPKTQKEYRSEKMFPFFMAFFQKELIKISSVGFIRLMSRMILPGYC